MHMGYFEENSMVGGRATHREAYVDRTHVSSQLAAGGSGLVRRGSLRGEPFSGNGHGPDPALGAGPPGVVLSLLVDVFPPSGAPSH